MPVNDRKDLVQVPTVPTDLDQRVWFGAVTETVKDAFAIELKNFFDTTYKEARAGELPRIDKYAVAVDVTLDPLETAVSVVRSYPDIIENLPTIGVLATTGKNLKLGLGDKYTAIVIPQAEVVGGTGPFTLASGMTLTVSTQPTGVETNVVQSTYIFQTYMFADITQATPEEVVRAINAQALYAEASVGADGTLRLKAGGPRGYEFPNKITVLSGTALTALGFVTNQTDKNYGSGKKAYTRHHMAAELTVALEVFAESENVRTELADLLYDFISYVLADRKFQFYGRSIYDPTVPDETYQIIVRDDQISFAGEQEMPRPGDSKDKIYVARFTVPVMAILYSDRTIVNQDGTTLIPQISVDLLEDGSLPQPN